VTPFVQLDWITRFPKAKKLVGYAGLGASVHLSGKTHRGGRITKQGRRDLRWIMIQAAWIAVEKHPFWKARFETLAYRIGRLKAIVAIVRKLLVVVWHVLTERVADRNADPEMVAFKLMLWSWKLDKNKRSGLTTRQFVRYHLLRLSLGHDLTHIKRTSKTYGLALKPELDPVS